jgi:hypothetical protein
MRHIAELVLCIANVGDFCKANNLGEDCGDIFAESLNRCVCLLIQLRLKSIEAFTEDSLAI